MQETERRWEFDAVAIGQKGVPVSVEITNDLIQQYARTVRNDNPAYYSQNDESLANKQMEAMPTMAFRIAPLRRHDIAANNGFVALEIVSENPRQTPFAKCEIRWLSKVSSGDVITSNGRILDKYERRGNKFVTFRVEAENQHGEKVCEYDYTCIFEYRKGKKSVD